MRPGRPRVSIPLMASAFFAGLSLATLHAADAKTNRDASPARDAPPPQEDGASPQPLKTDAFAPLVTSSPFTRSLGVSDSLILTGIARFKVMERKLFYGIMTPGAVLTLVSGVWLWFGYGFGGGWLHAKVALVAILVVYHVYCGKLMLDFKHDRNRYGHVFYRWLNEFPTVLLLVIVILVVVKPF